MFGAFLLHVATRGAVADSGGGPAPSLIAAARRDARGGVRNSSRTLDESIALGARTYAHLRNTVGDDGANDFTQKFARKLSVDNGSVDPGGLDITEGAVDLLPRLPYGFWRSFYEGEMNLVYTAKNRVAGRRALTKYLACQAGGASTRVAERGGVSGSAKRSSGGARNAEKARGLGHMLLQFFVDEIQYLKCRADSTVLMTHARKLRCQLIEAGWAADSLPKLDGNSGKSWFRTWRLSYGFSVKALGMRLKVPWKRVVSRTATYLRNVFRLRAFWALLHPGVAMRWLSLDQKPAWFNNAGHTGSYARKGEAAPTVREDFNQTRQRYSILSAVRSWQLSGADAPVPLLCLLFKGKKGVRFFPLF